MTHFDKLQYDTEQVAVVNLVNATANSFYEQLVNVFRPLVGTKILNWKDKQLKKEVKELVSDFGQYEMRKKQQEFQEKIHVQINNLMANTNNVNNKKIVVKALKTYFLSADEFSTLY